MTKTDLIQAIAEKAECTKKEADTALNAVLDTLTDALVAGEKVQIVGFGTFEVRERGPKECINPRTKEKMMTEAKKAPAFKAGKALKDAVNQ